MTIICDVYTAFITCPTRLRSDEYDFGVWWKLEGHSLPFSVSWIEDTGELYATNRDKLIILKVITDLDKVRNLMTGWEFLMVKPNSLNKLMDERIKYYVG